MYELNADVNYDPRNFRTSRKSAWQTYRRLVGYAWRYKARLILSIVFSFLVAGSFGAMIYGMAKVATIVLSSEAECMEVLQHDVKNINEFQSNIRSLIGRGPTGLDDRYEDWIIASRSSTTGRWNVLWYAAAATLTLSIIVAIARFLQEYFAGGIGANISVTLGEEMFENLIAMSNRFYDKNTTGEIMARFTNDIFMVNRGLSAVFVKLLSEPVKLVSFLGIALATDVGLTLIGICVLPPVAYVIVRIGRKVKKSVRRSLEKIASMAIVLNETFGGIAIVKAFCTEPNEIVRLRTEIQKLRRYLLQMVRADAAIGPITEVLLIFGFLAFILLSAKKVLSGDMDAGDLTALYLSLALMLDPVRKLSTINNQIQTSVASAERVFEYIDLVPEIVEVPSPKAIGPMKDILCFKDVTFGYAPDRPVLKGVSFNVRKGEMVAIVGFSGAGKSTIAKLVPRFYDIDGGGITIDGVDIREATFLSLRGQIGIVTQENVLFDRTVRENIAFAPNKYTEEQVIRAAKAAHAHEFISGLPQGYDTQIGESGSQLSGGQRQRIAIARALVKDPAILILDEATSSLDSESEKAIQEAIQEFVVGRTSIVIAHRLSTVRRADRIVVLNEGKVAEEGTHAELLARDGLYKRLYEIQFASQGEGADA